MSDKKICETYDPQVLTHFLRPEPRVFERRIMIRRYRVTIEEIEEPNEVLAERLLALYRDRGRLGIGHIDNMSAMRREAKKLGIELTDKEQ